MGVFTLLLAVLVRAVVRDRPTDLGWHSPADPKKDEEDPIELWEGVRMVLSSRSFWPLAVWFFFDCSVFFSFGGLWGGPYLMHLYGLSKAQAGHILSMIALGMVLGGLC